MSLSLGTSLVVLVLLRISICRSEKLSLETSKNNFHWINFATLKENTLHTANIRTSVTKNHHIWSVDMQCCDCGVTDEVEDETIRCPVATYDIKYNAIKQNCACSNSCRLSLRQLLIMEYNNGKYNNGIQ